MYRIPARRHPYRDHRDEFSSQLTPGGVTIQSPPRWSPQSPRFTSLCGFCDKLGHSVHSCIVAEQYVQSGQAIRTPYGGVTPPEDRYNSLPSPYVSPQMRDCSGVHLDEVALLQAKIDTLEKAQAQILARKRSHSSSIQSPVSPRPESPYRFAPSSPTVSDTLEYSCPRGPMRPLSIQSPDGSTIKPDYPDCRDDIAIKDYEPKAIYLDLSKYELPEEFEEPYQRPRGPMQPILSSLDAELYIAGNVSDQLATTSEIFAQSRDDVEIATTTAPVEEIDELLGTLSDNIFDEPESTQSSHKTSSSPVETHSRMWYEVAPEVQNPLSSLPSPTSRLFTLPLATESPVPPSSPLCTSPSPICHPGALPPPPLAIPLSIPSPLAPDSPTSLSYPSPSLSHLDLSLPLSDQSLGSVFWPQSFFRSFVTTASLCSKILIVPYYRLQPLKSAVSEQSSENFELGIDFEDPTDLANYSDRAVVQSKPIPTEVPNASGDRPRDDNNETADLPSEHDGPSETAEPLEYLLVLAEILADYEESDDTTAAPHPSQSPFLPSIALDIATLSSFLADDLITFESPWAKRVTPSKEPFTDERPSRWKYESRVPWSPLPLPSPERLTPENLGDPPPSSPTIEHPPLVATFSPHAPSASLPTILASPANATSPDIEPLGRYPAVATAPEPAAAAQFLQILGH